MTLNSNIAIDFDLPVSGSSINTSSVIIRGEYTGQIQGNFTGVGTSSITFNGTGNFKPGELVSVTLTQNIQSISGYILAAPYSFEFGASSVSGPETPNFFADASKTVISTTTDGANLVFSADLDGDGDIDVLSSSEFDNKIAWYENDGAQTFTEHVISTNALEAQQVYTCDIDQDGDMDVLSASRFDNKIAWYENDGVQTFTERIVSTNAGGVYMGLPKDVDGDGDIDILGASRYDDKIAWYENNGSQVFTERVISLNTDGARSVFGIDMDNDGDIDVLSASFNDNKIAWFENNGAQSFSERIISTNALGASIVYALDMDGDNDVDVLSASFNDDKIAWYENNGLEVFTEHIISTTADGARGTYAADMDGDGDIDVISASRIADKVAWYENDGAQVFSERTVSLNANSARSVFAADVDSDGDLDILSASSTDGKITWYENTNILVPFITTWKSDNPGISTNTQITIPTLGLLTYNYDIYWEEIGDPTHFGTLTGQTGDATVEFTTAGNYRVEISGLFPQIIFDNTGDKEKILTIEQWGDNSWASMQNAFYGCANLTVPASDAPNLSNCITLTQMFRDATSFNQPIGHWTISSSVNSFSGLFRGATLFNQDISAWNVSGISFMSFMFADAAAFNQPLTWTNTGNVTDMSGMFRGATQFNQDLSGWDVSKVIHMQQMFQSATSFNGNIDNWVVSDVQFMTNMFSGATAFNRDISGWATTSLTTTASMFQNATNFNQNLSSWNVSGVINMSSMFSGAGSFNQALTWDDNLAMVNTMSGMFFNASSFNQDISNWNTSAVTNMNSMFNGATSFNQNLGGWDISSVGSMTNMLNNSSLSLANYDATLIGWNTLPTLQSGVTLGASALDYCYGETARQNLIDTNGWTINGDAFNCPLIGGVNECDYNALVALYNATDGANWIDNTNWLSANPVSTWFGVSVVGDRVTEIDIHSNNLNGTIPPDLGCLTQLTILKLWDNQISGSLPIALGNMTALQELDLDNNQLTGSIPLEIGSLSNLNYLDLSTNLLTGTVPMELVSLNLLTYVGLSNNQLSDLQDLSSIGGIINFTTENNTLEFDDLEPNIGVTGFTYSPQANLIGPGDQNLVEGGILNVTIPVGGSANQYQWYKDGSPIASQTSDNLLISSLTLADAGTYYLEVTSTIVTGLILTSDSFVVTVTPVAPEIDVYLGLDNTGIAILDGQVTAIGFGSATIGTDIVQTFAIENTGTSLLTISSITSSATEYVITGAPATVGPGTTETFTLTLTGANAGVFTSTIIINNDDSDEGSFAYPVTGEIITPEHIDPKVFELT